MSQVVVMVRAVRNEDGTISVHHGPFHQTGNRIGTGQVDDSGPSPTLQSYEFFDEKLRDRTEATFEVRRLMRIGLEHDPISDAITAWVPGRSSVRMDIQAIRKDGRYRGVGYDELRAHLGERMTAYVLIPMS